MARVLPGLLIAALISGCGVRAAISLVSRLHARIQLLPSWTQTDTLELADTSLPFASPEISRSLPPPAWSLGYGADGQAELSYGPIALKSVSAGPYLETSGGWSSSRSVPLGPAITAAAAQIPGIAGSVEVRFDVASQARASGIQSLTRAVISSGSLSVSLANPLDRPVAFQAALLGLTEATDGLPVELSLPVASRSSAQGLWDLSGTVVQPDPSGGLAIWLRAYLAPGAAALSGGGPLTVSLRVSPLVFSALSGTVNYSQSLASQSVPFSLPSELARALSPAAASLNVRLDNQSAIHGAVQPQIVAYDSEGGSRALTFHPPATGGDPPWTGTFAPDATSDLAIDSGNSNLLDLLSPDVDRIVLGGAFQAEGDNVTVSAGDRASADLEVRVPLAFRIAPFGPGTPLAPIAIDPPVAISLPAQARDVIRQSLQNLSLNVTAQNGWQIPLDVTLLFSTSSEPASDPAALREVIHLGAGPSTESVLDLDATQSHQLADVQTMGISLSSPGSDGQVIHLHAQDALRLQVVARLGVLVSTHLL